MTDSDPAPSNASSDASSDAPPEEEEFAPTPFDGPYFLPVVLTGLALWFGYDGWINTDPSMQEHWMFNRVGAGIFAVCAVWFFLRARKEAGEAD